MSDTAEPIVFTRSHPTDFVLLVARVGPGTMTADPALASRYRVESLKPAGTDYASPADLREAGYVKAAPLLELLDKLELAGGGAGVRADDYLRKLRSALTPPAPSEPVDQ